MKKKSSKPSISKDQKILIAFVVAVFILWLVRELSSSPNIFSKRSVTITQPTVNNTPTTLPYPTTNYIIEGKIVENANGSKTYIDKMAGFSFTYTESGEFSQLLESKEGEYVRFTGYSISVNKNYKGGSKKQWYIDNFGNPEDEGYEVMYEDYIVDGNNALIVGLYDPQSMGRRSIYIFKGNTVYDLSFGYAGSENNDHIKKLASGLKFL